MGYDVHITRASDWTQNAGSEIAAEEWQAYIKAAPELVPDPPNGPNAVLWSAHPQGKDDTWLDWSQGNIYTTNPDPEVLQKMLHIAVDLNAKVQGDDKKVYETAEELER